MDSLASLIIRPQRAEYDPEKDLGPKQFYLDGKAKERMDFEITNDFGFKLKCCLFLPASVKSKYPCVIYCHGNTGSRVDALDAVDLLLPVDILVATLDFSGSGLSEGKYVTLGYNEKDDLKCLIKYLRGLSCVSDIGLWGRSMGASTAILHAAKDPEIVALCLDSPFSNLTQLCVDIMNNKTLGFLIGGLFFNSTRKHIQKKANFDIDEVSPIDVLSKCKMPSIFVHGKKDKIVPIAHSRKLFNDYPGSTKIHELDVDHNDPRPKWLKHELRAFFQQKFTEVKKKREFNSHVTEILNEKISHDDINSKKAQEIMKKLVYQANPSPAKPEAKKENLPNNRPMLYDPIKNNMLFNPLTTSFLQNKMANKFEDGSNSDSDNDTSFTGSKFGIKKPNFKTAVDADSDDDYPNTRVKNNARKATANNWDSDDSGDENPYPSGNREAFRMPNMADFLKFQQKKMPSLTGKLFNRGRGNSFDGRDEATNVPKGYHSKMVATAYNSDTE